MSITLKKNFRPALTAVSKVVSPRSTLPVLTTIHFRLDAKAGVLVMSATDMESTIVLGHSDLIIDDHQADFSACVPAAPLVGLVGNADDDIDLEYDPKTRSMHLKSGGSKASIKCLDGDDFPVMAADKSADLGQIAAEDLAKGLKAVSFAMSTDESRPGLTSTELSKRDGEVYLVAADGFRLAAYKPEATGLTLPADTSLLLPRNAVVRLAQALPDDQSPVTVEVYGDNRLLQFSWGDAIFRVHLAADRFPDWMAILPRDFKHEVEVPRGELESAVKRAEIFSRDHGAKIVRLTRGPEGKLILTGESEQTGSSETAFDAVEMTMEGIAFNVVFLRQAVAAFSADTLHLRLNGHHHPAMLSNGSDKFRCIIMPLHVGNDDAVKAANAAAERAAAAEGDA
jgi:DNA polymerase III subunit beta